MATRSAPTRASRPWSGVSDAPDRRPQRPAGFGAADLEVEVGHAVGRPVDAEDLADHPELEDGEPVEHQRRDALDHGSILIARRQFCHCWRNIFGRIIAAMNVILAFLILSAPFAVAALLSWASHRNDPSRGHLVSQFGRPRLVPRPARRRRRPHPLRAASRPGRRQARRANVARNASTASRYSRGASSWTR